VLANIIIIVVVIIITIIIIISFMQGIYTYIPETNYVPKEYSVAAILLSLFVVLIIIIVVVVVVEFLTSQLWLGNIHLFRDVIINMIRLGGLICSLKSFLQLDMCQALQIFAAVYMYWGAS